MALAELENLARIDRLKPESPVQSEFDGLVHSEQNRLTDAANESLSLESRFDLAYAVIRVTHDVAERVAALGPTESN